MAATVTPCAAKPPARPKPPLCNVGRFVPDEALVTGPQQTPLPAIVLAGSTVAIDGVCPPVAPKKIKATRSGTRLLGRWPACRGFSARLVASLSADCQSMAGTLTARWKHGKRKSVRLKFAAIEPETVTTTTVPAGADTTTTSTTVSFIRWRTLPPVGVAPGMSFPLAFDVTIDGRTCRGRAAAVSGQVVACPIDVPVTDCGDPYPFSLDPDEGAFSGPPGTFRMTVQRGTDCVEGTYYVAAQVYLADASGGFTVGPFTGPPAMIRLVPSATPSLALGCDDDAGDQTGPLVLDALVGGPSPVRQLTFRRSCDESFSWTASSDAAWLAVSPASGAGDACQALTLSVDASGLDPAKSPFTATVTIADGDPDAAPIAVTVTLRLRGGVRVTSTGAFPATLANGDRFALQVGVTGDVADARLWLHSCEVGVPFEQCADQFPLDIEPDFVRLLGGGTAAFTVSRPRDDCEGPADYYVLAEVRLKTTNGLVGPYLVPLGTTTLAPPTDTLEVGTDAVSFFALAPQAPLPQQVDVGARCGGAIGWTVRADQPWLSLGTAGGTLPDVDSVTLTADPTGLAPGATPYAATLTFSPVGIPGGDLSVPVALHVRDDVSVRWTSAVPAPVAVGGQVSLALDVRGPAPSVFGDVSACPSSVPPDACSDTYPFDLETSFEGPPGPFSFTATRGADCSAADSFYFLARAWLDSTTGDPLGPFERLFGPVSLLASPTAITVDPGELVFNAFGGSSPPSQTVYVDSGCGGTLGWRVTSDVPWLRPTPEAGSSGDAVEVAVDVGGLDPSGSPFTGTLTFTAPGAPAPVRIAVTLNLAC